MRTPHRMLVASTLAVLVLMGGSAAAQEPGADVYRSQCSSCHGVDGLGIPGAFPPLAGNPNVADGEYVADVIRRGLSGPIEVNGQTYDGAMPAFGGLSDDEVVSLVAFVQGLGAVTEPTDPPPTAEPPPAVDDGAAARGKDLFLGATRLENGGMACMACHSAGRYGNLGGSGLGPDLTTAHSRLGGTPGLTAILENPSFLVMRTAYADKPITLQERADLAAFMEATGDDEQSGTNWLLLIGLEGLAFLFAVMAIVHPWRGSGYANKLRRST